MIEIVSLPTSQVDFDSFIAHNEEVACRSATVIVESVGVVCLDATVIVNQEGKVTCWYDNSKPVNFLMKKEDTQ